LLPAGRRLLERLLQLARAPGEALFFAGEAADYEGEAGTVAGAMQSGARAAREVIKGFKEKSRKASTRRTRRKREDRHGKR